MQAKEKMYALALVTLFIIGLSTAWAFTIDTSKATTKELGAWEGPTFRQESRNLDLTDVETKIKGKNKIEVTVTIQNTDENSHDGTVTVQLLDDNGDIIELTGVQVTVKVGESSQSSTVNVLEGSWSGSVASGTTTLKFTFYKSNLVQNVNPPVTTFVLIEETV